LEVDIYENRQYLFYNKIGLKVLLEDIIYE